MNLFSLYTLGWYRCAAGTLNYHSAGRQLMLKDRCFFLSYFWSNCRSHQDLSCGHEAQPWFYLYQISITQIFVNEQQALAVQNPVSLRHADPNKAVLHLKLAWRGHHNYLVLSSIPLSEMILSLYQGAGGALITVYKVYVDVVKKIMWIWWHHA